MGFELTIRRSRVTLSPDSLLLTWPPHLDTWVGCPLLPCQHVNVKSRCSVLRRGTMSLQVWWGGGSHLLLTGDLAWHRTSCNSGLCVVLPPLYPTLSSVCGFQLHDSSFSGTHLQNHGHLTTLPIAHLISVSN